MKENRAPTQTVLHTFLRLFLLGLSFLKLLFGLVLGFFGRFSFYETKVDKVQ
jgi:hypothetical protein